jgi:hypothetical protein
MRRLIPTLFLLAAAGVARAADQPKPNTLTPKEIADGWILLFDGETTFGWKVDGEAKVSDGTLIIGGEKATTATLTTTFGTCEYRLEHTDLQGPGQAKVSFSGAGEGGGTAAGSCVIRPASGDQKAWHVYSGSLTSGDLPIRTTVRVEVPAGARVALQNFKIRPTGTKALFNGKDLTGWKRFTADEKRAKTEFSVTGEGYLHLKNGPGDLQSEKQLDDFVLQVECRTNGKNLNSGVFFRCIPGDYQNGYEAQIHNGFAESPKEYTVEEFDPKTHELKDKVKVKSAASDYGTGAIYRRVPARTHAANDNEWFTMTVVAHGRHIATWVNGVQQVDWTDNRPLKDNPRNGCRLEKGPISLQGHDPTTDIDFRSIRAVALPRPAAD